MKKFRHPFAKTNFAYFRNRSVHNYAIFHENTWKEFVFQMELCEITWLSSILCYFEYIFGVFWNNFRTFALRHIPRKVWRTVFRERRCLRVLRKGFFVSTLRLCHHYHTPLCGCFFLIPTSPKPKQINQKNRPPAPADCNLSHTH